MTVPVEQRLTVTVQDASAITGLSVSLIRKAIYDGTLRAHYLTRRPLIFIDDLRAWIANAPQEPPT